MGAPPPGMFGRMETTPGYRGDEPGHGSPLPGYHDPKDRRRRTHMVARLLKKILRRTR
jgi:hypothetical protein